MPAMMPKIMNAVVMPIENMAVMNRARFGSLKAYEKNAGMTTKPQGDVNVKMPPINAIRNVIESAIWFWQAMIFWTPIGRSSAKAE